MIKKGEQLNSLGFMFPSSLLYSEAFLKISLTFQIWLRFSMNSHSSFSSEYLRVFVNCTTGRNWNHPVVGNEMEHIYSFNTVPVWTLYLVSYSSALVLSAEVLIMVFTGALINLLSWGEFLLAKEPLLQRPAHSTRGKALCSYRLHLIWKETFKNWIRVQFSLSLFSIKMNAMTFLELKTEFNFCQFGIPCVTWTLVIFVPTQPSLSKWLCGFSLRMQSYWWCSARTPCSAACKICHVPGKWNQVRSSS